MARGVPITDDEYRTAAALRVQGKSWRVVATTLDRSHGAVQKWGSAPKFAVFLSEAANITEQRSTDAGEQLIDAVALLEKEGPSSIVFLAATREDDEHPIAVRVTCAGKILDHWSKIQESIAEARKAEAENEKPRETLPEFIRRVGVDAFRRELEAIEEEDAKGGDA